MRRTSPTLTQELMGLLAELKRDVPFFSGRYKGHMIGEQTIAAQIGLLRHDAVQSQQHRRRDLPGHDPAGGRGGAAARADDRLRSGALLGAPHLRRHHRQLRSALAGARRTVPCDGRGGRRPSWSSSWASACRGAATRRSPTCRSGSCSTSPTPTRSTSGTSSGASGPPGTWSARWPITPSPAIGYQEYSRRLALDYGDPLPAGVVLVAATAHYSWEKIVRALGIGVGPVAHVPVDRCFRMDPDALWDRVRALARRRQPIIALVSVCGTTEESAVDRLDQVLEVRARAEARARRRPSTCTPTRATAAMPRR